MNSRSMGILSIVVGIIVFALTMYVLLVPPAYLPLPSILLGVGTIISTLLVVVAIVWSK